LIRNREPKTNKIEKKHERMAQKIKVCKFDKKNRENKNKKKFKKAFACEKESFFIRKREPITKKLLKKSMRKHIDKQKMK